MYIREPFCVPVHAFTLNRDEYVPDMNIGTETGTRHFDGMRRKRESLLIVISRFSLSRGRVMLQRGARRASDRMKCVIRPDERRRSPYSMQQFCFCHWMQAVPQAGSPLTWSSVLICIHKKKRK